MGNGDDIGDIPVETAEDLELRARMALDKRPLAVKVADVQRTLKYWEKGAGRKKPEAADKVKHYSTQLRVLLDKAPSNRPSSLVSGGTKRKVLSRPWIRTGQSAFTKTGTRAFSR